LHNNVDVLFGETFAAWCCGDLRNSMGDLRAERFRFGRKVPEIDDAE